MVVPFISVEVCRPRALYNTTKQEAVAATPVLSTSTTNAWNNYAKHITQKTHIYHHICIIDWRKIMDYKSLIKNVFLVDLMTYIGYLWMFCYIAAILFFGFFAVKFSTDIPNLINENYASATVIVTSGDENNEGDRRAVFVVDIETDTEFRFRCASTPIKIGDKLEIIYLPNSGCGAILRKLE